MIPPYVLRYRAPRLKANPKAKKQRIIIAQVDVSGTAATGATYAKALIGPKLPCMLALLIDP